MNPPLPLSPFPALSRATTAGRSSLSTRDAMEGFVDEEAVSRMVARPLQETCPQAFRIAAWPTDLVLAAEEQDYACVLAAPAIQRPVPLQCAGMRLDLRRPPPPAWDTPALAPVCPSGQRWWLAGVTGALFTTAIALVLLPLTRLIDSSPPAPVTPPTPAHSSATGAAKQPPTSQELLASPPAPTPLP